MLRSAIDDLNEWRTKPGRKPLVLRGARQVGKTYLIRQLGGENFHNTVELNFEKEPALARLFVSKDPTQILQLIELQQDTVVRPGETLLFLDEIQAAPQVFEALRYFSEERPDVHVVAAGSLLEFAFEQPSFSVPVGRIEYMHLGPMTFEEFLLAQGKDRLLSFLNAFEFSAEIPAPLHDQMMQAVRQFLLVGGMPASVSAYTRSGSLADVESEKQSILETFIEDFGKYAHRVDPNRIRKVFTRLPLLVGRRLKYVNLDPDDQASNLARALSLLCKALVACRVHHSACNGVPLRAEMKESVFKPLFLDVGLMASACGLNLLDFTSATDVLQVNEGGICEQFVGQHLLYSQPSFVKPELFFWMREKRSSNAEVDYVINAGSRIVPVEVKAGKTGTLKSLQVFLNTKGRPTAVRLNSAPPTRHSASYALPGLSDRSFDLLSIPFYLVGQLRRLLGEEIRK
jgi:predicted AAA+ superfamily ATPase